MFSCEFVKFRMISYDFVKHLHCFGSAGGAGGCYNCWCGGVVAIPRFPAFQVDCLWFLHLWCLSVVSRFLVFVSGFLVCVSRFLVCVCHRGSCVCQPNECDFAVPII